MTQQIRLKLPQWSKTNVVLINVRLNEQTLVRMLLDTGAKYTIITPEVARRLELNLENARTVPVATASRVQSASLVTLQQVDLHGLVVQDIDTVVMGLPSALGVEGLLGISFLLHCRMLLDFPNRLLEFTVE